MKKSISVYVSDEQYTSFKVLAVRRGLPVAELIREAMAEYLEHETQARVSLVDLPAHPSGRLLEPWTRAELMDEMIRG